MKKILFFFGILLTMTSYSQQLNLNDRLPDNPRFIKGILKNGMTYYIYKTDVVKDAASYYIISNAGSILEEDNQRGLAHFLEHMAFNGTKNFPDKGVLNVLQKYGALFGQDINAATNFDKTVYLMSNIPTKDHMIDTCLLILHDWANEITLDDEEIDKERGVIKEEWRTRQSAQMRIMEQFLPAMFVHTKYAERLPIGTMDVVEHFKHDALRKFYHDWYRTDLQAIAIIGDVDVQEVEKKIHKIFSPIPAVKNPKERYYVTIPENPKMIYALATDKEITTPNITLNFHYPKSLKPQTIGDLKDHILETLFLNMINARFEEALQNPDTPFNYANLGIGPLTRTENQMSLIIGSKPDKQTEAFEAVLRILNQAVKFGFTKGEVDRAIAAIDKTYQIQISQTDNIPHFVFKEVIQNNYLENKALTDIEKEYEIAKKIFAQLTPEAIHNQLKKRYSQKNRVLLVTGVEGKKNLTEENALKIIRKVENDPNIKPYKDAFEGKTLLSGIKIKPGKIVSEKQIPEIGATEFTLSNGVKVYYKFTDKEKDNVQLVADSFGGYSLINDEDLPSADMITTLATLSGLGDYNRTDLMKILTGKTATSSFKINDVNEMLMGNSDVQGVETMLQLAYLRFVKPRFSKDAFEIMIHDLKNKLIEGKKNINNQMADSITVNLYGKNNPRKQILSTEYIDKISFDKIKKLYHERFKDPADFKFFIVGDISKEALKPLLEKYIASIPTTHTKENWKNNYVPWVKDQLEKVIPLKMETPKSTVQMQFQKDMEWSLKNKYLLLTVKDILQLRLNETLREDEGGTYGAVVFANIFKRPKQYAMLGIFFDCNPDLTDKLISIVYKEIEKLKKGEIDKVDLEKTITNYIKLEKQSQQTNAYDMDQLYTYIQDGINVADPKNTFDLFKHITIKDVQEFSRKFFTNARKYEFTFKPLD